jgi:hypothetical protein
MGNPSVDTYKKRENRKDFKQRICLSCQREFESKHKFNRLCHICKESIKEMVFKDICLSIKT